MSTHQSITLHAFNMHTLKWSVLRDEAGETGMLGTASVEPRLLYLTVTESGWRPRRDGPTPSPGPYPGCRSLPPHSPAHAGGNQTACLSDIPVSLSAFLPYTLPKNQCKEYPQIRMNKKYNVQETPLQSPPPQHLEKLQQTPPDSETSSRSLCLSCW